MYDVALVKYEKAYDFLKETIDLVGGFGNISAGSKVFIKPNFVVWHDGVNFPKYGILTTMRLIEDVVILLKEYGVRDITIVEGVSGAEEDSGSLLKLASKGMGLDILSEHYGVNLIDVHRGSFTKARNGDVTLSFNKDIFDADYIINMPVLKTHGQAMEKYSGKSEFDEAFYKFQI